MQKLQKSLLTSSKNVEKNRIAFEDVMILLLVYSAPVLNSILYILNLSLSSGQLAIIYIIVAFGTGGSALLNMKKKLPKRFIGVFFILLSIFIGFCITKTRWNASHEGFNSIFNLYIATVPSVLLLSLIVGWKRTSEIDLNLVFYFNLLITSICFLVLIHSNFGASQGLINDSSGFLYQNISYYASYCLGMSIFLLHENKIQKKRIGYNRLLLYLGSVFQVAISIIAGGRGGALLAVILIIYSIFLSYGFKGLLIMFVPSLLFLSAISNEFTEFATKFGIDLTGIGRTLSMFTNGLTDHSRLSLYERAIDAFEKHPIIGNGIGSVFYLFDTYSHNIFTDILSETGIVGISIFIIISFLFILDAKKMYNRGSLYRFLIMVFMCGFTLNLFSGYFLVNQFILLPMAVIITNSRLVDHNSF